MKVIMALLEAYFILFPIISYHIAIHVLTVFYLLPITFGSCSIFFMSITFSLSRGAASPRKPVVSCGKMAEQRVQQQSVKLRGQSTSADPGAASP